MTDHFQTAMLKGLESVTPTSTIASTASTFMFWGLHFSDFAVMLSAIASVCSVGLQFYVTLKRLRRLEREHHTGTDNGSKTSDGSGM